MSVFEENWTANLFTVYGADRKVADFHNTGRNDEMRRAELAAAAPDMYRALESYFAAESADRDAERALHAQMLAALKKARGE